MKPKTELALVKNFPHRTIAEAGRELLRQNSIIAIVQSLDPAGIGYADGCDLYVRKEDLERARELLESLFDSI